MEIKSGLSRRHFLTGMGGCGAIAAATGVGAASQASAAESVGEGQAPAALGPTMEMQIGSFSFRPTGNPALSGDASGGMLVPSGTGAFFYADILLPVGTRLTSVAVYMNPMGYNRPVSVLRIRPVNPMVQTLADALSGYGSVTEAVSMTMNHDMAPGFSYRINAGWLAPGGLKLYGARIKYRLST